MSSELYFITRIIEFIVNLFTHLSHQLLFYSFVLFPKLFSISLSHNLIWVYYFFLTLIIDTTYHPITLPTFLFSIHSYSIFINSPFPNHLYSFTYSNYSFSIINYHISTTHFISLNVISILYFILFIYTLLFIYLIIQSIYLFFVLFVLIFLN